MRRRRLDCEPLESRRIMLSLELPQRADPHDAASRFTERLLETLLGVGLAYA